jgi:hypothetical protein
VPTLTQESFESTSWHDNYVHALRLVEGADGAGELHLFLDHILEWMDGDETSFLFKVAPARLRFFGVSNLRVQLDYGASSAAMGPFQIDGIDRRTEKRAHYDAVVWTICATFPSGEIEFEATGYVQELTAPEIVVKRQWLTPAERGDV